MAAAAPCRSCLKGEKMKRWRWWLKDQTGAETAELVCLLPVEIFVFSLFLTFAQILYAGNIAQNAAAAGARIAIVQGQASEAKTMANQAATTYINGSGMGITFLSDSLDYTSWTRESICEYKVTVKIHTLLPVNFYGGVKNEYQVSQSCPMMIEK